MKKFWKWLSIVLTLVLCVNLIPMTMVGAEEATNIHECVDESVADHLCDVCGVTVGSCVDADGNHVCDVCGTAVGSCVDEDGNHVCDVCGTTVGSCADEDGNHVCDVCGTIVGSCVDEDGNHVCDVCGTAVGSCADEDGNHVCDLCGTAVGSCIDENNDGLCDKCGASVDSEENNTKEDNEENSAAEVSVDVKYAEITYQVGTDGKVLVSGNVEVSVKDAAEAGIPTGKVSVSWAADTENKYVFTSELANGSVVFSFENMPLEVANSICKITYQPADDSYLAAEKEYSEVFGEATENYKIYVNNIQINNINASNVLGDGTASYDAETNTLTLNNATIACEEGNYGIRAEQDLNLVLNGTNKVTCSGYYGICSIASLNISGSGSLESFGSDFGMYVEGALTIGDNVHVTASCGDIISGNSYGIRVNGAMTVKDNAVVDASAGYAPQRSCGIYAYTTLDICDNAVVNTTGGGAESVESDGIRTTYMTVSGGTVTAIGGNAKYGSNGIFTYSLNVTNGTITAKGGSVTSGPSTGLQANNSLTVSGGRITATGSNVSNDRSCGLQANNNMVVNGGVITATSGTGQYTNGVQGCNVVINNGTIIATAGDAADYSWGFQASTGMTMNGGYLEAESGDSSKYSYGIQNATDVDINGGTVYVRCGSAPESHGIWSFEDVNIKDAVVDITAGGNGISASWGSVNIGCTEVGVTKAGAYKLSGTKVTIHASGAYGILSQGEVTLNELLAVNVPENGKAASFAGAQNTIVDAENNVATEIEISPLGYDVIVYVGRHYIKVPVPAGQSVNEAYRQILGVEDFSEMINTSKEGYSFGGFYTDEDCIEGNEYNFDMSIMGDVSVYLKWIPDSTEETTPTPTPGEAEEATPTPTPGESEEATPTPTPGETEEATPTPTPGETEEVTPILTPETTETATPTPVSNVTSTLTTAPATGDESTVWLWGILMMISMVGMCVVWKEKSGKKAE